jgi:hypothetical protein
VARYRAAVIGLGWMGLLYDLAERIPDRFAVDDVDRPTPELDVHRRIHHHQHPGDAGLPTSYAEALADRSEIELVAGADRDAQRLRAFGERYGIRALYADAAAMLRQERPGIVAVCTNTRHRAELTCLAVECGARGIVTEKPMAHTLAEADRMVQTCAAAGVPLSCGAITTTHPSFARARQLLRQGAIGPLRSVEAPGPGAQHQNWSYFLEQAPAWVVGTGDAPRRESGSDEFVGQGLAVGADGLAVHFRPGAPGVRLTGATGEMSFDYPEGWRLLQEVEAPGVVGVRALAPMPWPAPQFLPPYGAIYSLADVIDCLAGRLDEPKNSGRRVATALEVEIALKQSAAQGGTRVDLPLPDRGLGLNYDWFR